MLDNGTIDSLEGTTDACKRSLSNYMTQFFSGNQLRGVEEPYSVADTPMSSQKKMFLRAYFNMWNRSTIILHTEDLSDGGLRMLQKLAPELLGSTSSTSSSQCTISHDNASPDADACGRILDSKPDERTRNLIIKHNQLDILMYKSAMRMYEIESEVLLGE